MRKKKSGYKFTKDFHSLYKRNHKDFLNRIEKRRKKNKMAKKSRQVNKKN